MPWKPDRYPEVSPYPERGLSYRLRHGPTLGDRARRVRPVTDMES